MLKFAVAECLLAAFPGAMDASQSKSCREPVRGEMRGIGGQKWSQRAWKGVLASYGRPQLMRDANEMYEDSR